MKTTMHENACSLLLVAALAAGCGGNTILQNTGGGGGEGGSGGGATTSSQPAECAVAASEPGPYEVTFLFSSAEPLYLREDCNLVYDVSSCADAYGAPLALNAFCSTACSGPGECIDCGACPLNAVLITSTTLTAAVWKGTTFTFEQLSTGCECHVEHVAPAGKYRISVPVFSSPETVESNQPAGVATADFELPASVGAVEVSLSLPH